MTFADACANVWTPTSVFWLVVGLYIVATIFGVFDRENG